ncbi:uncharacterized protein LOC114274479 isoform X2 [Camellia sinensis]|uniref:uncharacterized protein LOC114274479 isoform X2 n=1 Tax=Camellia sinensis TaxID=4442 RepID=UPI001035DF0D|nr:uncharacterized protein LOC114274479 isoform X2 [Camellia sinensis]
MEASDERRSATVVASDDRLSATVAARSDRSIDSKISCTNFYNRERIMMQLHLPNDPLVPTLALVIPRSVLHYQMITFGKFYRFFALGANQIAMHVQCMFNEESVDTLQAHLQVQGLPFQVQKRKV